MRRVEHRKDSISNLNELVILSTWGAVLVVASFLFLFAGRWIDVRFNTEPFFMVGLLILAIFLVIARLYREYNRIKDQMGNIRRRHA
jgi:hypothetical protein